LLFLVVLRVVFKVVLTVVLADCDELAEILLVALEDALDATSTLDC